MLSNAYFLAKFRFDTAENEPAKNLQNFRKMHFSELDPTPGAAGRGLGLSERAAPPRRTGLPVAARRSSMGSPSSPRASVGKISAKCCSFSAVSEPIFARKYAFCSIFQNLPDYQAAIFGIWQTVADFAAFANLLLNFHENCRFFKPIFC